MLGIFKRMAKAGAREIKQEYGKSKDFLEAVCAASALVAAADGDISDVERGKAVSLVSNHSDLSKLYQRNDIETTLETMFKRAKDASGRQQLARELDDIKGIQDGAKMAEDVYLVALDIAASSGDVDAKEQEVLNKIAARLGVDPKKFEF